MKIKQNTQYRKALMASLALAACGPAAMAQSSFLEGFFAQRSARFANFEPRSEFRGGVYAMTNEEDGNSIVAYGRRGDGTLDLIGSFATGGDGGSFDGGEGLDPLISAYAVTLANRNRTLLAVNAGSGTITSFRVNRDRSLRRVDQESTLGVGPNSIATHRRLVYVSNIDEDGEFNGEPDQEGSLTGYFLTRRGNLIPIPNSERSLGNRPSAVRFSPDGRFLLVSSINAGSIALESGSQDSIVVYRVRRNGRLSREPVAAATSTLRDNAEGRNLPSAIGFEIVRQRRKQYVVVTEAREFRPDGTPPIFPALQTGSVSTWELTRRGDLVPIEQDVLTGEDFTDGERTACWLDFSRDNSSFWVSNALEATLSTYSFNAGEIELQERVAAAGQGPDSDVPAEAFGNTDGWIDLETDRRGEYIYQLFGLSGTVGVFKINEDATLTEIQQVSGDLPDQNTQGIAAF